MTQKVLVIDDEPSIRQMLCENLSLEGYEAYGAKNGEEGLVKFNEHEPYVTILDLEMPKMGGLEFLKQLSSKAKISHSIIVLTGHGSNRDLRECYQLGVQSFLRKPVNLFELSGVIKRSCELRQYSIDLNTEIQAREEANHQLADEITQKEEAFRQLEIEHKLLKKTFDGIAEGVVTLDQTFRIQRISEKVCMILDIKETDAIGKPAASVLGAPIAGPSGELVRCVQFRKDIEGVESQLLCQSGAIIPIRLTIKPLHISSKDGWLLLFQDLREEERILREKSGGFAFGQMYSCNPEMEKIFDVIDKIATSRANVLVQGESGTGKELVAQEIHARSSRAQGPFRAVNCAAISPNLLESEFFGHERGAFTGATQTKPGHFELANHGTFFLDEVGEIPLELQAKLLRVLQEQTFERVGGTKMLQVDVRVVAATNQDLKDLVEQKLFREDLYYRLHVVPITLPPLRDRVQDIPLLTNVFIDQLNEKESRQVLGIAPEALQRFLQYSWPGNIRELYHVIEYSFAISRGSLLQLEHLPEELQSDLATISEEPNEIHNEKELIYQALQRTNFNKPKAAALLGIHRSTFYRKLKKYGIDTASVN